MTMFSRRVSGGQPLCDVACACVWGRRRDRLLKITIATKQVCGPPGPAVEGPGYDTQNVPQVMRKSAAGPCKKIPEI